MNELSELKAKYNKALERNQNAEEYLKTHSIEECLQKRKIKAHEGSMNIFDLFNEVVRDLSLLAIEIESRTGVKMTNYEILHGFKL